MYSLMCTAIQSVHFYCLWKLILSVYTFTICSVRYTRKVFVYTQTVCTVHLYSFWCTIYHVKLYCLWYTIVQSVVYSHKICEHLYSLWTLVQSVFTYTICHAWYTHSCSQWVDMVVNTRAVCVHSYSLSPNITGCGVHSYIILTIVWSVMYTCKFCGVHSYSL